MRTVLVNFLVILTKIPDKGNWKKEVVALTYSLGRDPDYHEKEVTGGETWLLTFSLQCANRQGGCQYLPFFLLLYSAWGHHEMIQSTFWVGFPFFCQLSFSGDALTDTLRGVFPSGSVQSSWQ